ncbi:MAG: hypothetical protein JNK82_04445 [Myxococcaceae bacterium]|nr:hypothetical protein [Myxococcaceae bacterium]
MGRRLVASGAKTLDDIELAAEEFGRLAGEEVQAAKIAALPPEDGKPKPCPRCGKRARVKTRNRVRHYLTTAGEVRLSRNYHYCSDCKHGFYPRDIELKLPEEGDVSDAMEKRILDFAMNASFEGAAERWDIHYTLPISSNLCRHVVDRVGRRREKAHSRLALQKAALPSPQQAPGFLLIAADGSMLADDVMRIVWLGDGAPENWTPCERPVPLRHSDSRLHPRCPERHRLRQEAARRERRLPSALGSSHPAAHRRQLARRRHPRAHGLPASRHR